MRSCPICEEEVEKRYLFCPMCGFKLDYGIGAEEYPLDRIRYLWERQEGGKIIYDKFAVIKEAGILPFKKVPQTRIKLTDFNHILLKNLQRFSFLYLSPRSIFDLYKVGKLTGYYATSEGLKALKFEKLVSVLNKAGLFWKVFQNREIKEKHEDGWKKLGAGIIRLVEINKAKGTLRYHMMDTVSSIVKTKKPICFMELGALCGQVEALSVNFWDGIETKCISRNDSHCEVEIYLHKREEEPKIEVFTKDELENILDQIAEFAVDRDKEYRKEINDFIHILVLQCINYILISKSIGHAILSKHSGKICGERIANKANISGLKNSLKYLEDLFLYLKAGILHSEEKLDRVLIKMEESVYASGVENIHMKLCIFLAGIIEGVLNIATDRKWDVIETKCIANGDPCCEFQCKTLE